MGLRQRCQEVYQAAKKLGIKSVRALSRSTNLSKSSVHRLSQRIKRRHQEPESSNSLTSHFSCPALSW